MFREYKANSVDYYMGEIRPAMTSIIVGNRQENDRIAVILPDFTPEVVAHEAVHVTWKLQSIVGRFFSKKIQEPQSYMVGFIVSEILGMKKQAHED